MAKLRLRSWVRYTNQFWKDMAKYEEGRLLPYYRRFGAPLDNPGLIYLGEIPNQKGHGLFYNVHLKETLVGLHIEDFEEVPEDET